jgi:DNA repair exonuclease SbcCD ATPase subunit
MFRFTIRDVLWLTVVVGLAVGWVKDHNELSELRTQIKALRDDLNASEHQLEISQAENLEVANELRAQKRLLEMRLSNAGKQDDSTTLARP